MPWFGVKILQRAKRKRAGQDDLLEETVFLIEASDATQARHLALEAAARSQVEYRDFRGRRIEWKTEGVEAVFPLLDSQPQSGTQIYSRFVYVSNGRIVDPLRKARTTAKAPSDRLEKRPAARHTKKRRAVRA